MITDKDMIAMLYEQVHTAFLGLQVILESNLSNEHSRKVATSTIAALRNILTKHAPVVE